MEQNITINSEEEYRTFLKQLPKYRGGSRIAHKDSIPAPEPERTEEPEEEMGEDARSAQEYESDGMTDDEMAEILLEDE